jgi:hypothetical protein
VIPRYHVLLDDPEALSTELSAVARIVARCIGQPFPDALGRVRYGRGIVARGLYTKPARDLTRGLARMGLGAFMVAVEEFLPTPRARRVGEVEIDDEGLLLTLRGRQGAPPIRESWAEVWAINPCAVVLESGSEERGALRRGDPVVGLTPAALALTKGLRRHRERERAPLRLAIEILTEGPRLYRLLSGDTGIYANLNSRSDNSLENFLQLLDELLSRTPARVLIPPGSRRMQAGDLSHALFAKRESLENFTSWLFQAVRHRVSFDDDIDDIDDDEMSDADEAIVVGDALHDDGEAEDLDDDDLGSGDDVDDEEIDDLDLDADLDADLDDDLGDLDDADLDDDDLEGVDAEGAESDADVQQALGHFDQSQRLDLAAIEAMLSQSRDIADEDTEGEDAEADGEVERAMGLFDGPSGPWDVRELLSEEDAN